jgi:thiamine pyrophosphate-dependent acetolactate synthase large subunit-like protein
MFKLLFKNNYGFELLKEKQGIDPITMVFSSEWKKTKNNFINKNKQKIINFTELAKYMEAASSPILLIGMGAISYISELLNFCRQIQIPFILTLPLSGFASVDDPFFAFRMGHTATYCGNMSAANADLIIAIGTSFSVYTVVNYERPFTNKQTVISINIHPELYNTPFVDKYIISDGKKFMDIKIEKLNTKSWIDKIKKFKERTFIEHKKHFYRSAGEFLMHGDIFEIIQIHIDKIAKTKNVYFVADTGSAQPFTASFINFKTPKYHFITCGKYADMGCGLGTIIGFALNKKMIYLY